MGHVGLLGASECRTVTVTGSAGSAAEGTYHLGAIVDPHGLEAELFEDNNSRAGNRIGIGHRPDLAVTAVSGPVSQLPGQRFNASVTVCNQGTVHHHGDVELFLSADSVITPGSPSGPGPDTHIGYGSTTILAPGQCQTLSIPTMASVPVEGAYYLGAYVDPGQRLVELFEDNNAARATVSAWASGRTSS